MSKKRPTESSWDSDEELLNDTSGNAITAFPKTSELDLLEDDGEIDEDALLGDEIGAKSTTISFANDSVWPLTRQRSKTVITHQEHEEEQEAVGNEQAFVFEETDTADLEDELNVGGQEEDGSGYHGGDEYAASLYHQGGITHVSDEMSATDGHHVDYVAHGINTSEGSDMGYVQAAYVDESGAEFGEPTASEDYIGDTGHDTHEDSSGVELEYEQPVEHEEQVHLEYEDSHSADQEGNQEAKNANYESESDSDNEDSRHSRGKFTSERTGVISLTPANTREAIPDTLEINEEQAAQIEQFMSDKTQKGKGKGRSQSRPSVRSRLGSRSGARHQQISKQSQGSRSGPFPRGMLGQSPQGGFPFSGGPLNRGPFPSGLLNVRSPFALRLLNQGLFPGAQSQRQAFPFGPGAQRGSFSAGSLNMLLGGPQRGLFPRPSQERFARAPNQRGHFPGGPQSQRLPQQNLRNPQGPQQARGPPPNQLRPQGSFNQRMANAAQFGHPQMGQLGMRQPGPRNMGQPGPRNMGQPGPRNMGPRPLMGQAELGMRFVRAGRPQATTPQNQPIPSLVKPMTNLEKSPLGNQQLRPGQVNPLMAQAARRISPHHRLGPMQGPNRFQNPAGQPQGPPRFMARVPGPGGPFMNPPGFPGNQQPPMGGQGDMQMVRKHKIYINPRFQGQQGTATGPGLGRTVKMGVPIQQKKAKVLLERAIQTQNKQASSALTTVAGVKRKSTGGESVPPTKITKSEANVPEKSEDSSTRVVQASNAPGNEESPKMKALLEEQRKQREMIQRKKELARQKQAAIKRRELETRLKEEGKTIDDILGTAKPESSTSEQKEIGTISKQISGSVAARLGPPPGQQQIKGPQQQQAQPSGPQAKIRTPLPLGTSGPPRPQQFLAAPQQSPTFQPRTPIQGPTSQSKLAGHSDPRMRGPAATNDSRFRGPPPNNNLRMRGPPPSNDLRFRGPPPSNDSRFPPPNNQFRASQPGFDSRYKTSSSSQDLSFRGAPPSSDLRLRDPTPMTDPRFKGPSYQATTVSPSVPSQSVRYTAPPSASSQTVRFQAPHSAPPQVPSQAPTTQQFQLQYTPSSAQPSHPPNHYPQPSYQSEPAVYSSSIPQYTPPVTSYQPPVYPTPGEHQYQPQAHLPLSGSESYIQSSQYQLPPQQLYQTPALSQYQTPPPTSQYQAPPSQTHYQNPPVQSLYQAPPQAEPLYQAPPQQHQYHAPPPQPQYQTPPSQQYQTPASQPQYQASSVHQYQSSVQSYNAPSDSHYQQATAGYYSEPQPIQTVTSQTAPEASPVGDQRTVQHHMPVGQRIQTIGQRVQPVSGSHMRSIIHNTSSQPSSVPKDVQTRLVQSQTVGSRQIVTDGQVPVLDGPQRILIQNVPTMATKETLIKICRHFGQVLGVNLMSEQNKAVVQFQKGEQAAKCVAKCDQRCLHKTRLTVKLLP